MSGGKSAVYPSRCSIPLPGSHSMLVTLATALCLKKQNLPLCTGALFNMLCWISMPANSVLKSPCVDTTIRRSRAHGREILPIHRSRARGKGNTPIRLHAALALTGARTGVSMYRGILTPLEVRSGRAAGSYADARHSGREVHRYVDPQAKYADMPHSR